MLAASGAVICMLMVAYGCGSGGGELSKAEFVKQADAICKKARHQASKNFARHDGRDLSAALASALNKEADEIGALDGPSGRAAQIEALLDSARDAADEIEASKNDVDKVERAAEKAERRADKIELLECFVY